MTEPFRNRVPYSPIVDRPRLQLPKGARLAVWIIVNVEHWRADQSMPRVVIPPPMSGSRLPDLPNWAWHEYGMRVGIWRLFDALGARGIRATLAVNGRACVTYRPAVEAAHKAGWEFIGHGFEQMPMHHLDDQQRSIEETIAAIRDVTGVAPRGWESPGMTEDAQTLDCLSRAGIEYVADWVLDDQPVVLSASPKPIVSVPYTLEINDVVAFAVQNVPPGELLRRTVDQAHQLAREGSDSARIMAISIHPYLTGVPHRIKWLHRALDQLQTLPGLHWWTGSQILDWYLGKNVPGVTALPDGSGT